MMTVNIIIINLIMDEDANPQSQIRCIIQSSILSFLIRLSSFFINFLINVSTPSANLFDQNNSVSDSSMEIRVQETSSFQLSQLILVKC